MGSIAHQGKARSTEAEFERYCSGMTTMWAAAFRFLAATGMREAEAFGLRWFDVAADKSGVTLTETKNGRPRFIKLSPEAVGILVGIPRHIKKDVVFWHDDGEPFRNVSSRHLSIKARINKASKKAGKGPKPLDFRVRDLRHWFAVKYLRVGGSIYDLQPHLGHSSVKVTEIYLDYLDPEARLRSQRRAEMSA